MAVDKKMNLFESEKYPDGNGLSRKSVDIPCDGSRILVADDDASVRVTFRAVFRHYLPEYSCDIVGNGLEAVRLFSEGHHRIVLTDLHMPVLNGKQAFDRMMALCSERHWQEPCVLFCTGYAPSPDVYELVANNPAHALLVKPVENCTLIEAVRNRLDGKRASG